MMNAYGATPYRQYVVCGWMVMAMAILTGGEPTGAHAEEGPPQQAGSQGSSQCGPVLPSKSSQGELEGIQIESSDIGLYERFFSQILHADEVQHIDHPQIDFIRAYCYRNTLIVVRQDLKTPRPTGWVQINFSVADVGDVQKRIEQALRDSDLATVDEAERRKVVRLRFKPDVPRNNCRVDRLEVNGPEGFMIGFDHVKDGSCKNPDSTSQKENREHNRPHH